MIHRNSQPYACQPPNAHTHPFTLTSPLTQLQASLPPVVHAALHNDGSRRRSATDMFDSMLRACRASPVGHFRGAVSRGGQGTLCSLQLASSNVIYFDLFAFPARLSLLFILKRTRQIISYGWGRGYVCIYHDLIQWTTASCVCHNHFYEFNFQCPSFCVVWFICVLCSTNGRTKRRQQCPLLISSLEREIGEEKERELLEYVAVCRRVSQQA